MEQNSLFSEEKDTGAVASKAMSVLVPYPIDKAYDYIVPAHIDVGVGDYVCVPLGNREIAGVVWGEPAGDFNPKKLKCIISKYDLDPMPKAHRDFIDWVAHYTVSMKGSVLKMSLSARGGLLPPKPKAGFHLDTKHDVSNIKSSPQRQKVMEVMRDGRTRIAAEIADMAGCSAAVVRGMADKGLLEEVSVFNPVPCIYSDYEVGHA